MTDELRGKGRPTLYKPEYCDRAIALMRKGMSITALATELDVCKDTVYEWIKAHEDFADAIKKGRTFSEAFWENEALNSLRDRDFNATLWYMNMKNRFGWRDQQETRHVVDLEDTVKKVRDAADKYKY